MIGDVLRYDLATGAGNNAVNFVNVYGTFFVETERGFGAKDTLD